jgi:hypothetical protein
MDGDDYCLEIDQYRNGADRMHLIHFRAHKWTPRVLRRIRREWDVFRTKFTEDLYATAQVETPAWHKFVKLFGFTPLIAGETVSDGPRLMYIHRTHDGQLKPTNPINN